MFYYGLLLLLFGFLANGQEIKSTGFQCANETVKLECPSNQIILVSATHHKRAQICQPELDKNVNAKTSECVGIDQNDEKVIRACNGKQACNVQVFKKTHILGFYGTNCDFESNSANIFYTCVPGSLQPTIKSFDICERDGPEVILGISNGFIHSPNYPDYYENRRNCLVNIGVPEGKRLILYLLTMSMEGLSFFDGKVRDYLLIQNNIELYGHISTPYIVYNGSDREQVQLKFKTDWITSSRLSSPKGFLLYFSLIDAYKPIVTTKTTTEEPATYAEQLVKETKMPESLMSSIVEDENLLLQKHKLNRESKLSDDRAVTIISVLVGLVGILILIIFGLLLMFRNKPKQQNDDYHIYDTADAKSMSNTIYNNISQISEYTTGSLNSDMLSKSLATSETSQIKLTPTSSPSTSKCENGNVGGGGGSVPSSNKFNMRLKKLYHSLNKTLKLSNKMLSSANGTNDKENVLNNTIMKEDDYDESSMVKSNVKEFNVNEFNPNDVDVKFEKDIAIDTLRLCKTPALSHSPMTSRKKLMNKHRVPFDQSMTSTNDLNRTENAYVSDPIYHDSLTNGINTESNDRSTKKLQIYEVNFDNNFAYITPAAHTVPSPIPKDTSISDSNTEIYQTIANEDEEQEAHHEEEIEAAVYKSNANEPVAFNDGESMMYETPTNKRLLLDASSSNQDDENPNSSVIHLLNNQNNEASS